MYHSEHPPYYATAQAQDTIDWMASIHLDPEEVINKLPQNKIKDILVCDNLKKT